ncbi:hypothetical protein HU200_001046 [Digitaria exilis]|uniref:Protein DETOXIFICATION n=1 Tax=Digitaria exilis TaxID=1010633 RepID=A0A835FZI4_9POAL|nr:hypothetical protein HU200_001046 [Digitaria exilis]CAB3457342.1 unnamed protein product [Digitaria exilis]
MESQQGAAVPLIAGELLPEKAGPGRCPGGGGGRRLAEEVWEESKKLWDVVGPAVFMRVVLYSLNIVSQAFVGRLGDRDLAAFSIATTVFDGLNFGLLFGMASALETLCGQAYGARQHHMMGIYLQRSWLILLAFAALLSPVYVFSGELLAALGQPAELARQAGLTSMCMIPSLFMYAIILPAETFLQCQLKNWVTAVAATVVFPVHAAVTWLLVRRLGLGVVGAAMAYDMSWLVYAAMQVAYAVGGGCPETWSGFSASAFAGLMEFVKLSASSGVMVCLENWYYRILIFLTGYMKNAEIAVDALSICMSLSGLEMMIHLGFLAGTGVRVANELGVGNGQGARFAMFVSTAISFLISLFFSLLTLIFHDKLATIFTSSEDVINAVDDISVLLALTILLNGIQPVLSGVAVGSG